VSLDLWATFCLRQFPLTRPWGTEVRGYVLNAVSFVGTGFWRAVPGLIVAAFVVTTARVVSRGVGLFFLAVEQRNITVSWLHIYPDTAASMRRLARVALWSLTVVVIYPYLPGSQTEVFKALGVFAGVVLSLGSSGLVSQLVSGFILVFSRVFAVGDYVRIGEVEGTVTSIGVVSTKIQTVKREEVNIPNIPLLAELRSHIQDAFNEHGVQIMSPHYRSDPSSIKVVRPEDWYRAPASPAGRADSAAV